MRPQVSVIVPIYNREQYIQECLDSICMQKDIKKEIICVDDGSTDGTWNILKQYAENYPEIVLLRQSNSGVSVARNLGLETATGEYIAFIDSDDWYPDENVLSNMYRKAKSYNISICVGGVLDNGIERPSGSYKGYTKFQEERICSFRKETCLAGFWRFLYERDFLNRNNIKFPIGWKVHEDWFFLFEVIRHTDVYLQLPVYVYSYRANYRNYVFSQKIVDEYLSHEMELFKKAKKYAYPEVQYRILVSLCDLPIYKYICSKKGQYAEMLKWFWGNLLLPADLAEQYILPLDRVDYLRNNQSIVEQNLLKTIRDYKNLIVYGDTNIAGFVISLIRDKWHVVINRVVVSPGRKRFTDFFGLKEDEIHEIQGEFQDKDTLFLIAARLPKHAEIQEILSQHGFNHSLGVDYREWQCYPSAEDLDLLH